MVEVISRKEIENVNCAMILVLEYINRTSGTEYVIEDGRITTIVRKIIIKEK